VILTCLASRKLKPLDLQTVAQTVVTSDSSRRTCRTINIGSAPDRPKRDEIAASFTLQATSTRYSKLKRIAHG